MIINQKIANYNMYVPIKNDIIKKKNLQSMYFFLEKKLEEKKDIKNLYYILPKNSAYGDYATTVLMFFINKRDIDYNFKIYSETGCSPWNENYNSGLIKCIKKDFKINELSDYDIIIVENNNLFLNESEKYNISQFNSQFGNYQISIIKGYK